MLLLKARNGPLWCDNDDKEEFTDGRAAIPHQRLNEAIQNKIFSHLVIYFFYCAGSLDLTTLSQITVTFVLNSLNL